MSATVLIVDDDPVQRRLAEAAVRRFGFEARIAETGADALSLLRSEGADVVLLDLVMPGLDGLGLVKTLRAAEVQTPVLFLTTMAGIGDRVAGLEAGGDDYLVKPFAFVELLARVHALGRRRPVVQADTVLRAANLEMDLISRKVRRGGREIDLQPREFRLLEYLLRNAGRVVTRTMLLEQVWEFHFDPRTNIVETHISRLRSKVDKGFEPELIETVRGTGYLLRATFA